MKHEEYLNCIIRDKIKNGHYFVVNGEELKT